MASCRRVLAIYSPLGNDVLQRSGPVFGFSFVPIKTKFRTKKIEMELFSESGTTLQEVGCRRKPSRVRRILAPCRICFFKFPSVKFRDLEKRGNACELLEKRKGFEKDSCQKEASFVRLRVMEAGPFR